jgi:ABC-type spermidine/putrescine transport system permease subunit II
MSDSATKRIALARTPEPSSAPKAVKTPRSFSDRLFGIWGVLVLLFLFAPIIVIFVYSFNTGRLLISFDGFGIDPYLTILNKPAIQNAVWVSIRSGVLSALFATAIGTLAGVAMARKPGKWVGWFLVLLILVTVTPEIVDAISLLPWVVFLGQDLGLTIFNDGIFRLVVGNSLFSIAVVSYIVRARLVGISEHLEEASADHTAACNASGARRWAALVYTEPGQHDHRFVRAGFRYHAVARVRSQCGAKRIEARNRVGVYTHADCHTGLARVRGVGAETIR